MTQHIYDDNENGNDVLCDCIRVVHFRGRVALIHGLCDYVYTINTCRIQFIVSINSLEHGVVH